MRWTMHFEQKTIYFSAKQDGVTYFVGTRHDRLVLIIQDSWGTSVEDVACVITGMEKGDAYARAHAIACRIKPFTWKDSVTKVVPSHCELNKGGITSYFAWKTGAWQVHWSNGRHTESGVVNDNPPLDFSTPKSSLERAKEHCEQHFRITIKNFLLSLDLSLTPV